MIRIIIIINGEQFRISFTCDIYILHILINDIIKCVLEKIFEFIKIYVCDFKKVFNHNHINCLS